MPPQTFHNLNRVSLGALRAVEAAARLGSVRGAADALNVTPGAVSQQILKAEAQLNRTLFIRTPSGLVPTEIGQKVTALLRGGFENLDRAVALSKPAVDVLTVSVAPVFASRWLVKRLPSLEAQHDGLRVNVDATADYIDPGVSGIDACLRVTDRAGISALNANLSATWLADQFVFPVCNPTLAAKIKNVSDLAKVPVIRDSNTTLDWATWLDSMGSLEVSLRQGTSYSDASLCIDAAIAGGGVFLAWDMLATDAVLDGQLVKPFAEVSPSGLSYWLVQPKRSNRNKRLKQLEDWLKLQIADSL